MNKAANVIKDLVIGKPEQRFKKINANLDNIRSEINLVDKKITNLKSNGKVNLSEEDVQKQVADLKTEKVDLENKLIEKQYELKDIQEEYKNRKVEEHNEASVQRQNAYVENTEKEAKDVARAIAESTIAVRKARLAARNRTHQRFASRNHIGGKRKSQKKRRTNKRK